MKILFVLENYLPHIGGVEVLFMNLIRELVKKGHEISIVTHRMKNTSKFEKIDGANVHRVNCFHSRYLFTFLSLPKIWELSKDVDIVHTTTFNGAPPAWLISKIRRKPCLLTVHEVWVGKWRELTEMSYFNALIHDLLERMIYSLSFDKYACVSKSTLRSLQKIKSDKQNRLISIYNGVDYDHWNPARYLKGKIRKKLKLENNFIILSYGRPGVSKGIEYMIKAMPQIIGKIPSSRLILILSQDPAYKKRYDMLMSLIDKLGIQDYVIVEDPISYKILPNYHKDVNCVVVPSLSEGFGFTTAESVAMGVPVIATDNASLTEIVSYKYVLIKPKNSKAIADSVVSVSNGKYITTKLKKFEWKTTALEYVKLYAQLIKQK